MSIHIDIAVESLLKTATLHPEQSDRTQSEGSASMDPRPNQGESDQKRPSQAERRKMAWRREQCHYFQYGNCKKGQECKFAHTDNLGLDWHKWPAMKSSSAGQETAAVEERARPKRSASSMSSATAAPEATSKTGVPQPPWQKRGRTEVVVVEDDPNGSSSSNHAGEQAPSQRKSRPTNDMVYNWLSEERAVGDQKADIFVRDAMQLINTKNEPMFRAPYETLRVHDAAGKIVEEFTLGANQDIVWCTMLYGRGERVQKHLANALMLGSDLRRKVKPHLQSFGCTFANVLFVTPDALDEYELKAVSWFWSVKIVEVPEVSTARLRSIAGHLCDENIHPAHVFLKVEAFKIHARISMISDLDMLILNPKRLARFLNSFVNDIETVRQLKDCGNVAVMQRVSSQVDWYSDFTPRFFPKTVNAHTGAWERRHTNVSYCFGIIKPSPALAKKYMDMMASPGKSGVLSDQDLLGEVLASQYLEVNHNMVMFPSWFNHSNINHIRGKEILEAMEWKSFDEVPADGVTNFIDYFGAVHFSRNFDPRWDKGLEEKLDQMRQAGGYKLDLGIYKGRKLGFESFLKNFLLPLWQELRAKYARKKRELHSEIAAIVGASNPTPGLARAVFTLFNHKITPISPGSVKLKSRVGSISLEEDE